MNSVDCSFMAQALRLAERGLTTTDPNPKVGCVLVKHGRVIGSGWHRRAGEPHAEVLALRAASEDPQGATCYVTLEPCSHHGRTPPCTEALLAAGIKRVVIAVIDPNPKVAGNGVEHLRSNGLSVDVGLLGDHAVRLNVGFCKRHLEALPYVRLKLAMSLDGRIAMASGASRWISSAEARRDVHKWRARSSAILTGIGTVLQDNPAMTARMDNEELAERQPVRVVLDSGLRMPADARLLSQAGSTWILTTGRAAAPQPWPSNVEVHSVAADGGRTDLHAALTLLAQREINEVWVESGNTLSGALLQAGLVDELILYCAPVLLGHEARAAFKLPGLVTLADGPAMNILDIRRVGVDIRITMEPLARGKKACLPG